MIRHTRGRMPTQSAANRNTSWQEGVMGVGSLLGARSARLSQEAGLRPPDRSPSERLADDRLDLNRA